MANASQRSTLQESLAQDPIKAGLAILAGNGVVTENMVNNPAIAAILRGPRVDNGVVKAPPVSAKALAIATTIAGLEADAQDAAAELAEVTSLGPAPKAVRHLTALRDAVTASLELARGNLAAQVRLDAYDADRLDVLYALGIHVIRRIQELATALGQQVVYRYLSSDTEASITIVTPGNGKARRVGVGKRVLSPAWQWATDTLGPQHSAVATALTWAQLLTAINGANLDGIQLTSRDRNSCINALETRGWELVKDSNPAAYYLNTKA